MFVQSTRLIFYTLLTGYHRQVSLISCSSHFTTSKSHSYRGPNRSRHIKCDELKPKCQRCVKEGFECIYQLVIRPRNELPRLMIAPKEKPTAKSNIVGEFDDNRNFSLV